MIGRQRWKPPKAEAGPTDSLAEQPATQRHKHDRQTSSVRLFSFCDTQMNAHGLVSRSIERCLEHVEGRTLCSNVGGGGGG